MKIKEIIDRLFEETFEDVFEARTKNPWRSLPRKTKLKRGYLRVTKHGVEYISPHQAEYPFKPEEPKKGREKKIKQDIIDKGKKRELKEREEAIRELTMCYI